MNRAETRRQARDLRAMVKAFKRGPVEFIRISGRQLHELGEASAAGLISPARWAAEYFYFSDAMDTVRHIAAGQMNCVTCDAEFSIPLPAETELILLEPIRELRQQAGSRFVAHGVCAACVAKDDATAVYKSIFAKMRELGVVLTQVSSAVGHA